MVYIVILDLYPSEDIVPTFAPGSHKRDIKCIRELPTVQQLFRIYTYTKGLHGITAIGFPVAMESTYDAPIDNLVISGKTGAQAMAAIQAFTNKYTLSTNVTKTASASLANTNVNSAIANVFLSTWGGEILYSNYDYISLFF